MSLARPPKLQIERAPAYPSPLSALETLSQLAMGYQINNGQRFVEDESMTKEDRRSTKKQSSVHEDQRPAHCPYPRKEDISKYRRLLSTPTYLNHPGMWPNRERAGENSRIDPEYIRDQIFKKEIGLHYIPYITACFYCISIESDKEENYEESQPHLSFITMLRSSGPLKKYILGIKNAKANLHVKEDAVELSLGVQECLSQLFEFAHYVKSGVNEDSLFERISSKVSGE